MIGRSPGGDTRGKPAKLALLLGSGARVTRRAIADVRGASVRDAQAGFSLVEMLVALAIVGVLAGVAALTLGDRGPTVEAEARRLADRLTVALDETLATRAPVALAWDPEGYAFEAFDPVTGAWSAPASGPLAGRRDLPRHAPLEATPPTGRARIGPDAFVQPLRFALGEDSRAWVVAFDGVAVDVRPVRP